MRIRRRRVCAPARVAPPVRTDKQDKAAPVAAKHGSPERQLEIRQFAAKAISRLLTIPIESRWLRIAMRTLSALKLAFAAIGILIPCFDWIAGESLVIQTRIDTRARTKDWCKSEGYIFIEWDYDADAFPEVPGPEPQMSWLRGQLGDRSVRTIIIGVDECPPHPQRMRELSDAFPEAGVLCLGIDGRFTVAQEFPERRSPPATH